jgi:hypothetical protein
MRRRTWVLAERASGGQKSWKESPAAQRAKHPTQHEHQQVRCNSGKDRSKTKRSFASRSSEKSRGRSEVALWRCRDAPRSVSQSLLGRWHSHVAGPATI